MTTSSHAVDVTRQAGWLPEQEDLEAWLEGHRDRVRKRGEQVERVSSLPPVTSRRSNALAPRL